MDSTQITQMAEYMIDNLLTLQQTAEHFSITLGRLHHLFRRDLTDEMLLRIKEARKERTRKNRRERSLEAAELAYSTDYSFKELAERLGISRSTLSLRLKFARETNK